MIMLTGCAKEQTESVETEKSEYEIVLEQMEAMGIIGESEEISENESQYFEKSAIIRGTDKYVSVTTNTGETYCGALINGEVQVWKPGDYDDSKLKDISEHTGNAVIQILTVDEYSGDIDIVLFKSEDGSTATYTAKESDNYVLGLTLEEGTWSLDDYTLSGDQNEVYYIELVSFNVGSERTVEQIQMGYK